MTATEFYIKEKERQENLLSHANRQLNISSFIRIIIFLAVVYGIYFFLDEPRIAAIIAFAGIAIFLLLVSRHTNLQYKRDKIAELVKLNELELKVLKRDFKDMPTGIEYNDPLHPYSQDIDLFGIGSFFQYLNRTALREGSNKLAFLLKENITTGILEKQEAIKELSEKPEWRQEFTAVARLVKTETSSYQVLNWFRGYKTFVPRHFKITSTVFSLISLAAIIAYGLGYITGYHLILWFFMGWLISGFYSKRVNALSENVGKVQDTFHQYHQLLTLIEKQEFSSEILKNKRDQIISGSGKASVILKNFSKAIDALEQRNNKLLGFVIIGFMLWDLRQSLKVEKWILQNKDHVENWFEIIEFFDAYNSLGNFSFNHASYVFPEITGGNDSIKATEAAHPLLDPEKSVANDFEIENEQFFIITGANMAGKSTFLRTVSLQIVMANVGLPVCASTCLYNPIKLITSMRTTDSLSDDESYFFSELKRLQFIVGEIKKEKYFIILDEILKGTNSKDKAIGSRKFIQKLVNSRSTGIIATHDLSLCEVSEELPQVKNHYFDAEIINDELHFDYRFKEGICQNMNASFLLKKMQIVD